MPFDLNLTIKFGIEDEEDAEITTGSIVTLTICFTRPSKSASRVKFDEKIPPASADLIEVHAPFMPVVKYEVWYLMVVEERAGIVLNCKKLPYIRDQLEVKLPFQAPRKPGKYVLTVLLMCDSYVGFDKRSTISIDVKREIHRKNEKQEEEEISEEEEEEEEEKPQPPQKGSDSDESEDEENEKENGNEKEKENGNETEDKSKDVD